MELLPKFDYEKVRFDQENLVTLMASFKAPIVELETERQPLNLVAVLDISGSMGGRKIEEMKKTAQILVDHLSEKDKLGIVIFATAVSKLASPKSCTVERKEELKNRIAKLTPHDTTNLSGATLLGFELMQATEGHINRLLLLTDGLPNVGVTNTPGLVDLVKGRPKGITLSTFGFGTDHNPDLLLSMAKAGDGNFYFIANPDSVNAAFAQELGGLLTCYAQNISLKVEPKPGVEIDEVLNDAYEYDIKDGLTEVRIPDMFSEETRSVLLKVKLGVRTSVLPRKTCVAKITASFTNLITKKTETIEGSAKIGFVKAGEESTERDKEVREAEAFLEVGKVQAQAVQMANQGNYVGAQALMVNCVSLTGGLGTEKGDLLAGELKSWSSNLDADSYSSDVGYEGTRAAYSATTGRSGGQKKGVFAGTQRQKDMVRSFEKGDTNSSSPGVPVTHTPNHQGGIVVPMTSDGAAVVPASEVKKGTSKKRKKKKSNKPFSGKYLGK